MPCLVLSCCQIVALPCRSPVLVFVLSFEPFPFPFDTLLLRSLYLRGVIVSLGPPNMDNIAKVDGAFWRHGGVEDGEEQQQWHEWLDKQVESCRLVLSLGIGLGLHLHLVSWSWQ